MICRKCHRNREIVKGRPFCEPCNTAFAEMLGTMDYHIKREEKRRMVEDFSGYEDKQWKYDPEDDQIEDYYNLQNAKGY